MTLPADPLHPLWATPIGVHQWAEAADANALLARAFSGMRAHQRQNLAARVTALTLLAYADAQVRAIKRALEARRLFHPQLTEDITRHRTRRGRRECEDSRQNNAR